MINTIPFVPNLNNPRAILQINGINVNFTCITINTNTFYKADTFVIQIPLKGQTDILTLGYWSESPQFEVSIYAGYPEESSQFTINNLTLILKGEADEIDVDPVYGIVRLQGRDLTGRLIDKKTTRQFSNYTASQLAILLATENGLNPIVTPTHTTLGTFYVYDQTLMARQRSEWDLLTAAASAEGFVVYVEGNDLIFKPIPNEQSDPYVVYYQPESDTFASPVSNTVKINFSRDMTLAQDVEVQVRVPFNTQTGTSLTVHASSGNTGRLRRRGIPQPNGKKQVYSLIRSGLTKEQALQFAQNTLRNITIHAVKMTASMAGEVIFKKDTIIKVQGTDSNWDSNYYVSYILRTIKMNGFKMSIAAKNQPVDPTLIL